MNRLTSTALALFDFDGTITTHETMPEFVRRSISTQRLRFAQICLTPVVMANRIGLVSSILVRGALVLSCYRGASARHLEAAGLVLAREYLPTVLRDDALRRIAWHKAQGHTVAVVSGALDFYLAPWCKEHQLELICSSLEQRDGIMTGRYLGAQCVREEKARQVRARFETSKYSTIYAYGDSRDDIALLGVATKRYFRWKEVDGHHDAEV
jgi:phosphatidylglycerophosphatase C